MFVARTPAFGSSFLPGPSGPPSFGHDLLLGGLLSCTRTFQFVLTGSYAVGEQQSQTDTHWDLIIGDIRVNARIMHVVLLLLLLCTNTNTVTDTLGQLRRMRGMYSDNKE